ncbi:MAG: PH domain-containing protein, partial [Coriobacteriales bacterium]|nr:PH domain-containing protein [Coriobacteriales bacterium]
MSEQTPNIPQPPRGYTPPAAQPAQQPQRTAPYAAAPVAQQPVQQPYSIAPGPHHVHKSVIALWTFRAGLVIFFSILFSSFGAFTALAEHTRNPGLWVVLILFGVLLFSFGPMLVISYISYKRFTWEVTDTELHVRRGLISIKNTHIPFQRIHSLDPTATLLDRALGLVTLNVQTAGSARPEATINGLKLQDAEALRAEIFARKRFAAYQAQAQAQARYAQGTGGAFNAAVDGAVASAAGTM